MLTQEDFPQLVTEFKDSIFRICLGFVKNQADAEDLAQEVFMEAYLKRGQFKANAKVQTWLYRIAVNQCLGYLRKQKRWKRKAYLKDIKEAENKEQQLFPSADSSMEQKEQFELVRQALDRIPESQKIAFILRKVEALSPPEIASIMKKTTSAVDALLIRAHRNLTKELKNLAL
jgi:RNA polymerase sigma-70 factor (ECF subfamily)